MEAPGTRARDDAPVDAPVDASADASAARAARTVPAPPSPPGPIEGPIDGPIDAPPGAERARGHAHDPLAWRRRIKADPTLRKVYRGVVGFVGIALMVLAASIGWLPGPAGIPLFLLGLAILASEFEWAHRLLQRAKVEARKLEERARRQPRWVKWLGGVGTAVGIAAVCWAYLALLGVPGWFPASIAEPLLRLPAVDPAG